MINNSKCVAVIVNCLTGDRVYVAQGRGSHKQGPVALTGEQSIWPPELYSYTKSLVLPYCLSSPPVCIITKLKYSITKCSQQNPIYLSSWLKTC